MCSVVAVEGGGAVFVRKSVGANSIWNSLIDVSSLLLCLVS